MIDYDGAVGLEFLVMPGGHGIGLIWLFGLDLNDRGIRSLDKMYDTTQISALTIRIYLIQDTNTLPYQRMTDKNNQARGSLMDGARAPSARTRRTFFSVRIPRAAAAATRAPASVAALQLHTQHARVPLLFPPSLPSTSPSLSSSPPPTTASALPCFCPRNNLRHHRTSRRLLSPRSSPSAVSTPRLNSPLL